jgi:hypothetical protein
MAGDGGAAGATGGDPEYVDASGKCRRALEPGLFGCPDSYDTALAQQSPCGMACAGPADGLLVYLRDCTPTVRCAYDVQSRGLVGAYWGNDVPAHCNDTSLSVTAGEFPSPVALNGYDVDQNCAASTESVSPLFNELFPATTQVQTGKTCRSGHDDCRGAVRMFVCADDQGTVAGDGTCQRCENDAQCQSEYDYAAGEVRCGAAGTCEFTTGLVGACPDMATTVCQTAAGAFACIDGACARCETSADCEATSPGLYDICQDGTCMHATQP